MSRRSDIRFRQWQIMRNHIQRLCGHEFTVHTRPFDGRVSMICRKCGKFRSTD